MHTGMLSMQGEVLKTCAMIHGVNHCSALCDPNLHFKGDITSISMAKDNLTAGTAMQMSSCVRSHTDHVGHQVGWNPFGIFPGRIKFDDIVL